MNKAEEQYLREEWHGHTEDGTECDCYIALLKARDKRIAELEQELADVLGSQLLDGLLGWFREVDG